MKSRERRRNRAFGVVLTFAVAGLGMWPGPAAAQARIEGIRVGRYPDFDRIVLDLAGGLVPAYVTTDARALDVAADLAEIDPRLERTLGAVRVGVERGATGTRLVIRARPTVPWRVFRLAGTRPRIVLDIGRGAVGIPADAEPIPERPPSAGPRVDPD